MKPEDYSRREIEIGGWAVIVESYRLDAVYHCTISNADPAADRSPSSRSTRRRSTRPTTRCGPSSAAATPRSSTSCAARARRRSSTTSSSPSRPRTRRTSRCSTRSRASRARVLAATEVDGNGDTKVLGGDENTGRGQGARRGGEPADRHGRRDPKYYEQVGGLPPRGAAAKSATGKVPTRFHDGEAWIDYQGGPGSFPTLSFIDVVKGRVDPADVRGKIVVVGASAPSLQDRHATPTSAELMAGPRCRPTRSGRR